MSDDKKSETSNKKKLLIALCVALLIILLIVIKLFSASDNNSQTPTTSQNQTSPNQNTSQPPLKLSFDKGELGRFDMFEFKINKVIHGWSNEESVVGGEELIAIDLTIKNLSDDTEEIPMYDVKVKDSNSMTAVYSSNTIPGDMLDDLIRFKPGESITGQYVFSVPKDEHDLELIYITYIDDSENPGSTKKVNFSLAFNWQQNKTL